MLKEVQIWSYELVKHRENLKRAAATEERSLEACRLTWPPNREQALVLLHVVTVGALAIDCGDDCQRCCWTKIS